MPVYVPAFAGTHCAYPRRDDQAELTWVVTYIVKRKWHSGFFRFCRVLFSSCGISFGIDGTFLLYGTLTLDLLDAVQYWRVTALSSGQNRCQSSSGLFDECDRAVKKTFDFTPLHSQKPAGSIVLSEMALLAAGGRLAGQREKCVLPASPEYVYETVCHTAPLINAV